MAPVLVFTAASGTGKTTLLEGVIRALSRHGLRVAALKHGHHPAEPDMPGKDSHRFRQAGAATVLFACPERWFMVQELAGQPEPPLADHIQRLRPGHDIILVEGFHASDWPKILIHRVAVSPPLREELARRQPVVAIATDDPQLPTHLPLLPLDDPDQVAAFILDWMVGLPTLGAS